MSHGPQGDVPEFIMRWPNLAQSRLGAVAVAASDEFFAAKERLIDPHPPISIPDKYDDHGAWKDGWETRRKRVAGYDYCLIRLGRAALVYGVDIDTAFFTGNFPPAASLDGSVDGEEWSEIVPATTLHGDAHHYVAVGEHGPWNWLRLNIYPDGGVARLRVHGRFVFGPDLAGADGLVELSGLLAGARPVAWSDAHYGSPGKVFLPDRGINMGDGWETHRRRVPGNEWQIVELGHPGLVQRVLIDTSHNKGNYPDRISIQAANVLNATDLSIVTQSMFWPVLLPEQPLGPDREHTFTTELDGLGPVTHARINLIPDGGVSRIRLFGRPMMS
jgi:allantoicase